MKSKRGIIGISICLFVLLTIYLSKGSTTFEQALNIPKITQMSIIHQESSNDVQIVFCMDEQYGNLYTAVIKEGLFGYKNLYNALTLNIPMVTHKYGFTYTYFPAVKGMDLPIYFGVVGHSDIKQVKVTNGKYTVSAKIIETQGERLWIAWMEEQRVMDYDIIGYSEEGKELARVNHNIASWFLRQR